MRCRHEQVTVELTHGAAWVQLDAEGDVLDEGVEGYRTLLVLAICTDCDRRHECSENALASAPLWAAWPAARAIQGWRAGLHPSPSYVPRVAAKRGRR